MHASFGAQQPKSVFAFNLDAGAFNACYVACGFFLNLDLEVFALGIAHVLAQQHAGPVASLGAASARVNVQKAVVRVGRLVKHATKFHLLDTLGNLRGFGLYHLQRGIVFFGAAHFKQLGVVSQFAADFIKHQHHIVERFFLFAQVLGFFRVVPDGGVFE